MSPSRPSSSDSVMRWNNEDPQLETGNKLFAALPRPFMPKLATTANLIVVPHRSLHYIPFSALWFVPAG